MGKHIYLSREIEDQINELTEKNNFNFSEWVRSKFEEEFMSASRIQEKIDFLKKELLHEEARLNKVINSEPIINISLKKPEIEFLHNVRLAYLDYENSTFESITSQFNDRFKRKLTVEQFKNCIRKYLQYNPDELKKRPMEAYKLADKGISFKKQGYE